MIALIVGSIVAVIAAGVLFRRELLSRFRDAGQSLVNLFSALLPGREPDIIEPERDYDPEEDEEHTIMDMPLSRMDKGVPVRVVVRGFGDGDTDLYRGLSAPFS